MELYNIGQMIVLKEDRELKSDLSENSKIKKKGTKLFIGASNSLPVAHYLNGDIEILPKDIEIKGFSAEGIAEWLYIWLNNKFEIDQMLKEYEESKGDFKERIIEALEELGFYNDKGNIS